MHIHVIREDMEAKVWIEPRVELAENDGFPKHEINDIIKMVIKDADSFKDQYKRHIGKRLDD